MNRNLLIWSSALLLLVIACGSGEPLVIKGDKFNDIFPADRDGFTVTVTTEKKGFAQATLKKGEEEMATFAISDLNGDTEAIEKFKASTEQVSGYPIIPRGDSGTAALVGNRFQVQVRSLSGTISESDRKDWLFRFQLDDLAGF
tara:strand:+ start:5509 stop:5940 length:432 start_codon:yes stop_codon:yes gene_type:complete